MTVHTRLGNDAASVLDKLSELMNRAERTLHARLMAGGKWTGELAVSLYKEFGMPAKLMECVYTARQSKVASAVETTKIHVEELRYKIASKTSQIRAKERKLVKRRTENAALLDKAIRLETTAKRLLLALERAQESKRSLALQQYKTILGEMHSGKQRLASCHDAIKRLENGLHQHRRHIQSLRHRLSEVKRRSETPSICFGTSKLFNAQYNLEANGFANRSEWKNAWRKARTSTFMIQGLASDISGNRFARLTRQSGGLFDLELRIPEALKQHSTETINIHGVTIHVVRVRGLCFRHQADGLEAAINGKVPVSIRFHRDETSWKIMASFAPVVKETKEDYGSGAVGVDINSGFISVARADRHGNVVEAFDIPMVTYGKSQGQSRDTVRQVAAKVAVYASSHGLPIASELIDFQKKKLRLKLDGDTRYVRMLSSFAYSSFDAALSSACVRSGVFHRRVNPAYTSIIGRVKFAPRYGLSVHRAAALAIARRAMQLSEKLPLSVESQRRVTLPFPDARLVTLELPARKDPAQSQAAGSRHVRPDWKGVADTLRGALAARRPSRRKKPSRSITGWSDLRSMVGRRRRDVPECSTQSRSQRVGSDAVAGVSHDASEAVPTVS